MSFVGGKISKEHMARAHQMAASSVAGIRAQWRARQVNIDKFYSNAVARTFTMENFVDKDQSDINRYFQDKVDALKKTYGGRIQYLMQVPTVKNIYREFKLKADGTLDYPTTAEFTSGAGAYAAK